MAREGPLRNLVGFKRDRLEVIEYLGIGKYKKHWWKCRCECSNEITLCTSNVKKGPKSCGCLTKEVLKTNRFNGFKHGMHKHRLYSIWASMKYRCSSPKASRHEYYYDKGIKVSTEWVKFEGFRDWALSNGYEDGLTIDRIDPDLNYDPSNCQWITLSENTRRCNATKFRRDDGTFRKRSEITI